MGGVIYSLVTVDGEMKVQQKTTMSEMPHDDEESEREIQQSIGEQSEEEIGNSKECYNKHPITIV